ncbi:MAG: transcriptional regulator, partial [Acidimicrobiia bacterium]|nr:transcriptional regulator [Acidimicrobiia bacterium]
MERLTRATAQAPAVPEDLDDERLATPSGVVELPLHIRWSGPPRSYDMSDRRERARVYEQVLRERNDDDVRWFVRVDEVIDLWDELVLPRHVRQAWAKW